MCGIADGGTLTERCLTHEDDNDGGAEDIRFDVVAGDSPVTVTNFAFVASESRQNLEVEVYSYSGSYLVRLGSIRRWRCTLLAARTWCVWHTE